MEKYLAQLQAMRDDVLKEPETSSKNLVVALLNAAIDRLKDHIRDRPDAKPAAPAAPTPPAAK